MPVVLTLVIIPVAFVAAVGWTAFTHRTRSAPDEHEAVREFERVRRALAAPLPHR